MKVVIDGLIGAGKSTQANLVSNSLNLNVVKEPIEEWPLDLFYSDPRRWGFLMQTAVLTSFTKLKGMDGIFERSPQSSKEVFWRNLVQSGVVSKREDEVFQKLYDTLSWEPDCTIFIDKDPELCFEHIKKRNQAGDSGVTVQYLQTLDYHYKNYIQNCNSPVHVVDGNRAIYDVHKDIIKIINTYSSSSPWTQGAYM